MILDEIVRKKRERLEKSKIESTLSNIKERVKDLPALDSIQGKGFKEAIKRNAGEPLRLIAEIKKASPSRGIIREDFDTEQIALIYEKKGVSAISVLTEEDFFHGKLPDLAAVRKAVRLPIIRKDFIFDPYQIYESRLYGADAILLISSILEQSQIEDLMGLSRELGMDSIIEVHTHNDLDKALSADAGIIGINNRDLDTMRVNIETTFNFIKDVPQEKIVVSESGIRKRDDVKRLEAERVDAILVGTVFMEAPDIGEKIEELITNNSKP